MKPEDIKVGGIYGSDETQYRIERIDADGKISATPIRASFKSRKMRWRFCTLVQFARWAEREYPVA